MGSINTGFSPDVQHNVLKLLLYHDEARQSYPFLVLAYWIVHDNALPCDLIGKLKIEDDVFNDIDKSVNAWKKLTSPETITRASRVIQRDKNIFIDNRIKNARDQMQEIYRYGAIATRREIDNIKKAKNSGKSLDDFLK